MPSGRVCPRSCLGLEGSSWAPASRTVPVLRPPPQPLGARYQEVSSPPQTLRHQKHLLGHVLGHLGDSVPTVGATVLLERLARLSTRPGQAARGAAGRQLWGEDRASEMPDAWTPNYQWEVNGIFVMF